MKNNEKISYEVDPHNRLIVSGEGSASAPRFFRTVVDGTFRIEDGNLLTYHVKKSQNIDIPQKIVFSGNWSMGKDRNLIFTIDKWSQGCYSNRLIIKADLLSADSGMVSFAAATRDSDGGRKIYTLAFEGLWRVDKYNNLAFRVEHESGASGDLVFQGGWQVGGNNEIVYTYAKRRLKRGDKIEHSITLKGYWDISNKHRIIYVLDKKTGSVLEFRVSFAKPLARGLKYEIGIGAKPGRRELTIFGSWRVDERLGLVFEMPCEEGRVRAVVFGADIKLGRGALLQARLRNEMGKDLGVDLKLSKKLFGNNGEAYIEALKSGRDVSIVAGAGFRW